MLLWRPRSPPLCRHHSPFLRSLAHLRPTAATSATTLCLVVFHFFARLLLLLHLLRNSKTANPTQNTKFFSLNPAGVNLPSKGQSFPHPYLHVASRRRIERKPALSCVRKMMNCTGYQNRTSLSSAANERSKEKENVPKSLICHLHYEPLKTYFPP